MLETSRSIRITVMLCITLGIVASLRGAYGAADTKPVFASLDEGRILAEYKLAETDTQQLNDSLALAQASAKVMNDNPLLSAQDQLSLAQLTQEAQAAAGLTPVQKATMQKLQDESQKANDDFQRLQNTKAGALTAGDQQQLAAYTAAAQATQKRLSDLDQSTTADLQQKKQAMSADVQKNIHAALVKVAQLKGYSLVFSNQEVPYAEADCTDDVLKILNK